MRNHNQLLEVVERIIDEMDFCPFLELVAEICSAKADHVESNWGDDPLLVQLWNVRADVVLQVSDRVESELLEG